MGHGRPVREWACLAPVWSAPPVRRAERMPSALSVREVALRTVLDALKRDVADYWQCEKDKNVALGCRCGFNCDFLWTEYCVTSAPIVVPMSNIVALFRVHLPASKSPWTNVTAADFEATLLSLGLVGEHAAAAPPRLYSARVTGCCRPPRQRPRPLACGDRSSFLRVVARPSQGNKSRELDFQAIGAGKYTINKTNIAIRTTGSLSPARRARRMRAPPRLCGRAANGLV